ncbi:hypothetical protein HNQ94_000686 [Salirhabdus euzebyi]|uniref:YpoC-like domain-containing protein n=1 Tax=Salirhabdus euzebyi TaxID=394506 RepID=A0A841PYS8_9BACI|nr:hypothetical protein [Salirhabdus euzebyi]MBB6452241.1 hypothetical protein [Salirhabdus euzebyi]
MFKEVKAYIDDWKSHESELAECFRNKQLQYSEKEMIRQIKQFKTALYFCNEINPKENLKPSDVSEMEYRPVNILERLSFMEERPNHYHSFIQLRECFHELEKIYARAKVMKQRKGI